MQKINNISPPDNPKNAFLLEQVEKMLQELGEDLQPIEKNVVHEFCSTEEHLSVETLTERVKTYDADVDENTVRRVLQLLCTLGIAQRVRLDDKIVYEHIHLRNHHDHLICVKCHRIIEFENPHIEEEQLNACHQTGFKPLVHRLEIRGVCQDCIEEMPQTRPLTSCYPGETVEVVKFTGEQGFVHRLAGMGFVRGTQLRILATHGPVTVSIKDSRVALGRGQASRVIVQTVQT